MMLKSLVFLALLCIVLATSEHEAPKLSKKIKKSKVITVTEAPVSCYDQTLADRNDCLAPKPGYNCHFNLKENDPECAWKCNCIQDIVVKKEKIIRKEEPELNVEVKKIKKKIPLKKKKAQACDGIKTFSFKNCGIDFKGLIGWGKKTRNFDKTFKKFAEGGSSKKRAPVEDVEDPPLSVPEPAQASAIVK
jgi:hypothetical protein